MDRIALPAIEENGLAAFLADLVRVPSVNPPGNEGPVAALIAARLGALGFDTRIVESAPGRPNVIARLAGTGGGPTLLFNGHMDVQPPGSRWTRDPFAATVEGRRLYGQGAMDMKAGLAAMIAVVLSSMVSVTICRGGRRMAGDIVVTAVADEVSGGHMGTGFLVREGLVKADMAVVCEPTGDAVRVAHRGALWLEIEVNGRSAHGGRPWLGVNALSKAARIITALEDELAPSLAHLT
ncbi:MAG: M20/M25/M40 family metallo-hydrolase, partial [Rhodospirillaceae bacterium]